jgi:hypothetical protein
MSLPMTQIRLVRLVPSSIDLVFIDLLAGLNWYNGCRNPAVYVNGNRPRALFDGLFRFYSLILF